MTLYVVRRLGLLLLAIVVTSIVVFLLLRLLPGDLAKVIGGTQATPEQIAAIREELGLDRPLVVQYLDWIGGILRGDFGTSALNGETVTSQLGEKLTVSAPLVLASTAAVDRSSPCRSASSPAPATAGPTASASRWPASSASPCPRSGPG